MEETESDKVRTPAVLQKHPLLWLIVWWMGSYIVRRCGSSGVRSSVIRSSVVWQFSCSVARLFGGWKVWLFGDFGHFVASFEPISKHFFFGGRVKIAKNQQTTNSPSLLLDFRKSEK